MSSDYLYSMSSTRTCVYYIMRIHNVIKDNASDEDMKPDNNNKLI